MSPFTSIKNHIVNHTQLFSFFFKIADGAADNWRFLSDTLFPGKGVELPDYFHASEHLNEAMEAAYGKGSAMSIAKYQEYKSL
jgi:hypothetical protein